jgi:hypothetical protein
MFKYSLFLSLFLVCFASVQVLGQFWESTPVCPEIVSGSFDTGLMYPERLSATTGIPNVPQYPFGVICHGVFCDVDGFSPVNTYGNPYLPFPNLVNFNPGNITQIGLEQVQVTQDLLVVAFGSASLAWKQTWMHTDLEVTAYSNTPQIHALIANATGYWANQVTIRPTLSTVSVGPLVGGALSGFVNLIVPKAFDVKLARALSSKYGCTMPQKAIYSSSCPLIVGGWFSQARLDWNQFRTSTITPLHSTGNMVTDLASCLTCIKALLAQIGATMQNVAVLRVEIPSNDPAMELAFISAYEAQLGSFGNGWKPAMMVEKTIGLLSDPIAAVGLTVEMGFIGAAGEVLTSSNYQNVFSLSNLYSQSVKTPAGWTYTSQIFGTLNAMDTPVQLQTDGTQFYRAIGELSPGLAAELSFFTPGATEPALIYAQWVAQGVQAMVNVGKVLGNVGLDITDTTYQITVQGGMGEILPFFAISDASTIIFNRTQGLSGFHLPQRSDSPVVALPNFGGGIPIPNYDYYGAVISFRVVAFDRQNVVFPANNNGATPGVTNYLICDGTTDITTCPKNLQVDLGARRQPIMHL